MRRINYFITGSAARTPIVQGSWFAALHTARQLVGNSPSVEATVFWTTKRGMHWAWMFTDQNGTLTQVYRTQEDDPSIGELERALRLYNQRRVDHRYAYARFCKARGQAGMRRINDRLTGRQQHLLADVLDLMEQYAD